MGTELIVHSTLDDTNLIHNIQSTNLARLKQIIRGLIDNGYQIVQDIQQEGEYHSVTFWSFYDREYTRVPRMDHSMILKQLRISVNKIDVRRPDIISTYAVVPTSSRTRKHVRDLIPRRL